MKNYTRSKEFIEKVAKSKEGEKFNILDNNNILVERDIIKRDIRIRYTQSLNTIEVGLRIGQTRRSKISLNKAKKLHLIGYKLERIIK